MSEVNLNLEKTLKKFGLDIVTQIVLQLKVLDKRASGKLINSINSELRVLVQNINYNIDIEGEPYFQWVNDGRKPGKQPPINKIQGWCKLKGINTKFAFPIARKIGLYGIQPTNVLQTSLKNLDLASFEKEVTETIFNQVKFQIEEAYNKGKI